MAEIEEKLKSLLKKVKEESENAGLNLKIQKTGGQAEKHEDLAVLIPSTFIVYFRLVQN